MTSSPAPDLDELERLAKGATPGPWHQCSAEDGCGLVWSVPADVPVLMTDTDSEEEGISSTRERKLADAAYIAAASPDVILALLTELRSARAAAAESGRLREALDEAVLWMSHDANCPWRYTNGQKPCNCEMPALRDKFVVLLTTPPAPSNHGALDVERLAAAMEVISFHMMPRHPGEEFAQAIAAEYARLAPSDHGAERE